jgi:uncharacterized membrane protein
MEFLLGSFFFAIVLPLIAIVVALVAFSLGRRRSLRDAPNDARIAALEELVRGLLYRVWKLEEREVPTTASTAETPPAATREPAPPPEPVAHSEPVDGLSSPEPLVQDAARRPAIDFEQRIGARWATWVGVVAIFFGIGLFLKWSFENDMLGPGPRVLLGLLSGAGLLTSGLLFHRRRDVPLLSEGLAGLGLGVLYLALFGAQAVYGLLGAGAAFVAMCTVTMLGAFVAVASNRQITAILTLVGGLLTPVLLTVTEPDERNLFAYLLVLDLLVLFIARFRTWPSLNRLAWVGTALLVAAALSREPGSSHPLSRLALVSALFALFLAAPLLQPLARHRRHGEIDLLLVVLNAAGYFWTVHATLEAWHPRAEGPYALVLAFVYRLVAADYAFRIPDDEATIVVHEGVAWTFLTLAMPLALSDRWVTLAWAVQGVALLWSAARVVTPVAAWGGTAALMLAAARVVTIDHQAGAELPVWNPTFLVHLLVVIALGIGGLLAAAARPERLRRLTGAGLRTLLWLVAALVLAVLLWREPSGHWPATLLTAELVLVAWLARAMKATAWVIATPILAAVLLARVLGADDLQARMAADSLVNAPLCSRIAASLALALAGGWLSRSATGAGARGVGRVLSGAGGLALLFVLSVSWTRFQTGGLGRTTQVGLSVLWALYAAALLGWGFLRPRPLVRYAALALLGLTVFKVFYVDLSSVRTAYRIVSFLVLGVVLLGVSLLYQKVRN